MHLHCWLSANPVYGTGPGSNTQHAPQGQGYLDSNYLETEDDADEAPQDYLDSNYLENDEEHAGMSNLQASVLPNTVDSNYLETEPANEAERSAANMLYENAGDDEEEDGEDDDDDDGGYLDIPAEEDYENFGEAFNEEEETEQEEEEEQFGFSGGFGNGFGGFDEDEDGDENEDDE